MGTSWSSSAAWKDDRTSCSSSSFTSTKEPPDRHLAFPAATSPAPRSAPRLGPTQKVARRGSQLGPVGATPLNPVGGPGSPFPGAWLHMCSSMSVGHLCCSSTSVTHSLTPLVLLLRDGALSQSGIAIPPAIGSGGPFALPFLCPAAGVGVSRGVGRAHHGLTSLFVPRKMS